MGNVTIRILARELQLSAATVSKALADSHEISQPTKKRVQEMAAALNYTPNPVDNLRMKVKGSYRSARLISPDAAAPFSSAPTFITGAIDLRIPQLSIYSVVVLDWK